MKSVTINLPKNYNAAHASIVIVALGQSLQSILDEMAKLHGDKAGEWLDELEVESIRHAKGVFGEGVADEIETEGVKMAIDMLQGIFDTFRFKLTGE